MNDFTKNLLKTSATLMIIAGGASVLVGATNALTSPVIAKNAEEKEKQQLSQVFGDKADTFVEWKQYTDQKDKTNYAQEDENGTYLSEISKKVKYVTKVWTAKKGKSNYGYIARVYGKNGYGALDLLVGINKNFTLSKICIIEDSMSYKNKLEPGYIDPYNSAKDGKDKEKALANVKCGATIAATLMKNAVEEAQSVCKKEISAGIDKNAMLFGGEKKDYQEISAIPGGAKYVKEIYKHADGYIFVSEGKEPNYGVTFDLYIAVGNDGSLKKIYHDDKMGVPSNNPSNFNSFYDGINENPDKFKDSSFGGATYSTDFLKEMIQEAVDLVKNKSISMNSYDMDVNTDGTYEEIKLDYELEERR